MTKIFNKMMKILNEFHVKKMVTSDVRKPFPFLDRKSRIPPPTHQSNISVALSTGNVRFRNFNLAEG